MITLSIIRVKQAIYQKAGTYQDRKTGEKKPTKAKWIAEICYIESFYSKLLTQVVWRERIEEVDSEIEVSIGDWLVEVKTAYDKTVIVKVIGKADFNQLLPAKQPAPTKGEKQ